MVLTTVYFCNNFAYIAVGTPGSARVKLRTLLRLTLEEGCLINGVITNDAALLAQLSAFWQEHKLPVKDVSVVIDSTQFLSKVVTVPSMQPKKMLEVARHELAAMETRHDPVVDYMVVRIDKAAKTHTILASSVERSFLQQYVALFEKMGVSLCGIDIALACQMKLVDFLALFQGKTCIFLVFDGDNLQAILVENGRYKYSSRSRVFNVHATPEFGSEVTNILSSTLQFQLSDKSGYAITNVYFCGCDAQDYAACEEGCRSLNLSASMLPDDEKIMLADRKASMNKCVYIAGNYITR